MSNILVKNGQHWAITKNALTELIHRQTANFSNPNGNPKAMLGLTEESDGRYKSKYDITVAPGGIGIIKVEGVLYRYENFDTYFFGGSSYEGISESVMTAIYDESIKGILLYVNSPGGEVDGMFELSEIIRNAGKPVVSYVSGLGASAGYAIASSANKIISQQSAMTGSIGVISTYYDDSKFLEKVGIDQYTFVSSISPNKHPEPSQPEGASQIQLMTDQLGEMFLNLAATNRNKSYDYALENFGKGDIALADNALKMGLIDGVGSLPVAIEELRKLINNGDKAMIIGTTQAVNQSKSKSNHRAEETAPNDKKDEMMDDKDKEASTEEEETTSQEEETDETAKEEDKEETAEEETDEEEEIEKDKEVAKFAKANPGLFARVKLLGQIKEKKRQEEIDEVIACFPGQKNLIADLRYGSSLSAAEISLQSAKAQKSGLSNRHKDRLADGSQVPITNTSRDTGAPSLQNKYASVMKMQLDQDKKKKR
jgi:signal peptide peptidase SppA